MAAPPRASVPLRRLTALPWVEGVRLEVQDAARSSSRSAPAETAGQTEVRSTAATSTAGGGCRFGARGGIRPGRQDQRHLTTSDQQAGPDRCRATRVVGPPQTPLRRAPPPTPAKRGGGAQIGRRLLSLLEISRQTPVPSRFWGTASAWRQGSWFRSPAVDPPARCVLEGRRWSPPRWSASMHERSSPAWSLRSPPGTRSARPVSVRRAVRFSASSGLSSRTLGTATSWSSPPAGQRRREAVDAPTCTLFGRVSIDTMPR